MYSDRAWSLCTGDAAADHAPNATSSASSLGSSSICCFVGSRGHSGTKTKKNCCLRLSFSPPLGMLSQAQPFPKMIKQSIDLAIFVSSICGPKMTPESHPKSFKEASCRDTCFTMFLFLRIRVHVGPPWPAKVMVSCTRNDDFGKQRRFVK